MNDNLAPVFLDNKPVSLNDPKPKLSAILSASGRPETTDVKWLQFQANTPGKSLRSEEILDRTTDPSKPIYLTSAKGLGSGGQSSGGQRREGESGQSSGQGGQRREGESGSSSGKTAPVGNDPKHAQSSGRGTDVKKSAAQDDDSGMRDDEETGDQDRKAADRDAL